MKKTKNPNTKLINKLMKQEASLEKSKTKSSKETDLEKKISKLTGKKYIGKR